MPRPFHRIALAALLAAPGALAARALPGPEG